MSRLMIFIGCGVMWTAAAFFFGSASYLHMVTGAGAALLIHWVTR